MKCPGMTAKTSLERILSSDTVTSTTFSSEMLNIPWKTMRLPEAPQVTGLY